jgi:D-alanyl-D-alanine carboxypeptidase
MKNQAVAWGMFNTYFGDPTGLSSANQSTLDDLEIFMGHIWREYPGILAYSKNSIKTLTDSVTGKPVVIYAINKFASRPDFLGGKTGYTDIAKENLISVFNVNNRTVLTIILGSDDRFGDTEILLGWAKNKLDI